MKKLLLFLVLLISTISLSAQKNTLNAELVKKVNTTPVVKKSGERFQVLKKNLRKSTPSGYPITNFRVIHSKNKRHSFLVQEVKHPKSMINRYIPLKKKGQEFFLALDQSSSFVDCWLMRCSTCEEVVSGTGGVWCECSIGGCGRKDTSDPWKKIVEYAYLY